MKRTNLTLAAFLACAASAATVASAQQTGPAAHPSRAASVSLRHTSLGTILVAGSGRTVYEFTRDHTNTNSCAPIGGCSEAWPPLRVNAKPTAGAGVRASLLSTIRLAGGVRQVTYAGHPLYLYSGDSGPGETSYVGARAFGGNWYAVSPTGHMVR